MRGTHCVSFSSILLILIIMKGCCGLSGVVKEGSEEVCKAVVRSGLFVRCGAQRIVCQ